MKKIFLGVMGLAMLAVSCKKDLKDAQVQKELVNGGGSGVDTLVGEITVNSTVTRTTYLKGIVYVKPGVTLTVNAGVTIKGSPGGAPDTINLQNNKGTLVVMRGGKLIANGTPTSPIVWTSNSAAGSRNYGDWGGVVLFGKAPIKTAGGLTENFYEAFPQSDLRNYYGGTDANDNSGSITYNRFEFGGGIILKPNQEVNGLTFCGVGRATTIHHIEVANSGDDAYEFFGGTVNCHHMLSFGNKDDDYDFDEGYVGNLQFIIAYRNDLADNSGSEFVELDNNATAADFFPGTGHTTPTIANATFIGPHSLTARAGSGGRFDGGVYVRRQGRIRLANSLVIADSLPCALALTVTTRNAVDNISPATPDHSFIRYNIFQTYAAKPVVWDDDDSNPILGTDLTQTAAPDNLLIAELGNGTQLNTALATPADFKLDGVLKPLAGSPALSGGVSLTFLDPFFVSTTQRGAVITSDVWTATGTWISIATN